MDGVFKFLVMSSQNRLATFIRLILMNLQKRGTIHVAPPFNKLILEYEYLFRNIRGLFHFLFYGKNVKERMSES